jgi:hypothetical protein
MYSEDERVALMAADKVLERAWGRPKDRDQPTSLEQRRAAMSAEERAQDARLFAARVRQALIEARRARDEQRTIEGEAGTKVVASG